MAVYVPNPNSPNGSPADLIENLGAEIASRFAEAEELMIETVAKRASRGLDTTDAAERARVLGELRQEGARIAGRLADPEFVAQIIATAAADGEAAAIARLGLAGRGPESTTGITGVAANAVGQVAMDLTSSLDDMTARITRWMPDAYQHVISMTSVGTLVGAETLLESQRRATQRFLAMGVTGFEDAAGRQWRIGTYAEMASRTAVARAWQDAHVYAAQQYAGVNLVTIVGGSGMCGKCAPYVGRIYSTDGSPAGIRIEPHATEDRSIPVDVAGDLSMARGGGWGHPNCRCTVVAYLPGLSIPKGSTYDPQAEKDRDRLRSLERDVRASKRRLAATDPADDLERARLRRQIRDRQGKIRDHVAETGLLRRNYREQLHFSDGGPRPTRAPRAPRPVVPTPTPPAPRTRPNATPGGPTPAPAPPVVRVPPPRPAPTAPAPAPAPDFGATMTAARFGHAREAIKSAQTGPDVAAALTHLGYRVEGLDVTRLDMTVVRGAASSIVDLAEKYPAGRIDRVVVKSLPSNTFAQAGATVRRNLNDRSGALDTYEDFRIEINLGKLRKGSKFAEQVAHAASTGWFHVAPGVTIDPITYTMTHEFGHILDYTARQRLNVETVTAEAMRAAGITKPVSAEAAAYRRAQRSEYGRKNRAEAIAEAFADVETNGPGATDLSRAVTTALLDLLKGAP